MSYKKNNSDTTLSLLLLPMVLVVGYAVNGFVFSKLWQWFIITIFDLPPITVMQAIGISMVVGFLTYTQPPESSGKGPLENLIVAFFKLLFTALFALLFGWILHLFM